MDARDIEVMSEALQSYGLAETKNFVIHELPEEGEAIEFVSIESRSGFDSSRIPKILNALSQAGLLYRGEDDRLSIGYPGERKPAQYTHEVLPGFILLRDVHYEPSQPDSF